MATNPIKLDAIEAALEYQYNGEMQLLVPAYNSVQLTLHLALHAEQSYALFDLSIPHRYKKDKDKKEIAKSVNVRVDPRSIISLDFSFEINPPKDVKVRPAMCLKFRLRECVTVLIPNHLAEVTTNGQTRSKIFLKSLYELSNTTNLHIYIPSSSLSTDNLQSISTAIAQNQLEPLDHPDYATARMFNGQGAKPVSIPQPPAPPRSSTPPPVSSPPPYEKPSTLKPNSSLYNESVDLDSTDAPSRKRKQGRELVADSEAIWNKLAHLQTMLDRQRDRDAQASDASAVVEELRAEVAQQRQQISFLQEKCEGLESEVARLQQEQADMHEHMDMHLFEVREQIDAFEEQIESVRQGQDDDIVQTLKDEIFEDLAARVLGS
ncbi:unnamed protein product [Fusarium langsethiae]|nr:unnamed protein product [Fusarium langsethiae]